MTRSKYRLQIFKNDELVNTAWFSAWNSMLRSVPKHIKEISNVGDKWSLIDKYYAKNEMKQHIDGVQHWENQKSDLIRIALEKIGDE